MPQLDELLDRPGLAPWLRVLVYAQSGVWPGRWDRLREASQRGPSCPGLDRKHLEEMLLQAVLFCGFPRVVTAFGILQEAWPGTASSRDSIPPEQRRARGEQLFASIYGDNTDSVRSMLQQFHGEFHDFVLESAYGRILARPGLEPAVREVLAAAALAQMDQTPQFVAHGRGALALGASLEQLIEGLVCSGFSPEEAAERCRRIRRRAD